jgi:glycerol uptake facilitator-like aquaporin
MVELDDFKPTFTPAVAAEFIGMVLLQFLSAASAANAADNGLAAAALGTGFAVTMLMYSSVHISGGHLNPAITAGYMAVGANGFSVKEGVSYMLAQFLGAIVGSFVVKSCLPFQALVHPFVTLGSLSDKHGEQVFLLEFICTLVLGLVVFATIVDKQRTVADNAAPLVVGLAYAIGIFAVRPIPDPGSVYVEPCPVISALSQSTKIRSHVCLRDT